MRLLVLALLLAAVACAPAGAASSNRTYLPFAPRAGELAPPASVWRWQNPLPHGDALLSISFADDSTGWAVGDGGMVQKSTDGGQTWTIQSTPTSRKLRRVRALSPTIAWAAGDVGTVLRTDDGGTTWRVQPTAISDNLTGFDAPSASVAWASSDTHVFRTTDGGATWSSQPLPSLMQVASCPGTITAVAAPSQSDAYLAGGCALAFYTHDSGQTWQSHVFATCDAPAPCEWFRSVSAASARDVYLVGYSRQHGAYTAVSHVSHDGGATWSNSFAQMETQILTGSDVVALSPMEAWWNFEGTLRVTTDGGSTWLPPGSRAYGNIHGEIAATSVSRAWVLGGFTQTTVTRTSNGGGTWVESNQQTTAAPQWMRGVSVTPDGSTVWTVATDYATPDSNNTDTSSYLLRSTDAGGTWWRVTVAGFWPWSVAPAGAAVWVGGAQGAVARSTDGGASWSSSKLDAPSGQGVVAIAAASSDVAWVSIGAAPLNAAPGKIYRTSDGGQTWTPQSLPNVGSAQPSVMRMSAVSDSVAWGVDPYHCVVLRTVDAGNSWAASTPPSCAGLWGVFATSATTAFSSGQHQDQTPAIYETTDGGATWLDLPTGFEAGHNSVLFAIGGTGQALWAVGAGTGDVTASGDGGVTWRPQVSHAAVGLWGVAAASPSSAWAVGERGTILRATTS